ncbi:MAG TPA: hypothetical protein VHC23_08600, partial [Jatrophihabitans sp.]|nr:hypothetical protein [Jatrophihabitans sp.]
MSKALRVGRVRAGVPGLRAVAGVRPVEGMRGVDGVARVAGVRGQAAVWPRVCGTRRDVMRGGVVWRAVARGAVARGAVVRVGPAPSARSGVCGRDAGDGAFPSGRGRGRRGERETGRGQPRQPGRVRPR